jgi:DNA-binding SARP family transcriptional activator/tetratricopeptide (TPR) repeat protein
VEFRILGPVELWVAGQRRELGSPKEACVLAALLLDVGRPVSRDTLVDRVWGAEPPLKVHGSLWAYIARLRRRLADVGEARLVSRSGVYVLETDRENIDLNRFRRLRNQARAIAESGDRQHSAELLRDADQLWLGEALAGITGDWARQTRHVLEQERLMAIMDRVRSELELGQEADLARELAELAQQHPLTETIVEYLMVALYRSGGQAEALNAYRQARQRLVSELGTEPGPGLRALHQRILQGDQSLAAPPGAWAARRGAPNNLPRDIPDFIGREEELNTLIEAIGSEQARTSVTVVAIDGMAGVGKSTLAIHAAHRSVTRFPDGQLLLRLNAHDRYEEPVDPATALETLLRKSETLPPSLEERAALWREQSANRRMLIVLDDAASRDQIQPLLPGAPGCLVLITSRRRLAGLSGARSLSLDVMRPPDAAGLFTRIVGPERCADADAVAEIVRLCGYMPLAIQVVASRLRHRPAWTVADLAQRLTTTQHRLAEIRGEELEVASSFELSYRYLAPEQQLSFRRLGCYPGADFSLYAASAASGASLSDTERVLESLVDYHLLEESGNGRFRCHDLVREYSVELADREDTEADRREVTRRLLDFYLYQADRADRILYPHRRRIGVEAGHAPAEAPVLTTQPEAVDWMESERLNLLSAVQYAAGHDFPGHARLLPHVMAQFLEAGGYWQDAAQAHGLALDAWRAAADPSGEAQAHVDLCMPRVRAGYVEDALMHGKAGLEIFQALGDERGQAEALDRLGLVFWLVAQFPDALVRFEESLDLHRATGNRFGEAEVLGHMGIASWHTGRYREALENSERALDLFRDIGDARGEAKMLNNIGDMEQRLGAHREALAHYRQALPIAHQIGGRQAEAILLNNIGNACRHMGRYDDALSYLRQALEIYRDIGDRRGEADALNNVGATYRRMRRIDEAIVHHQKALEIAYRLAEDYEAARAQRSLGDVYLDMGKHGPALEHYRDALGLSRVIGDPYEEACALDGIGSVVRHTEGETAAREHWRQALQIFERLGVPEAQTVRSRLG